MKNHEVLVLILKF